LGDVKNRVYLKDLGIDGKVTVKKVLREIGWEVRDRIDVIQGREAWGLL